MFVFSGEIKLQIRHCDAVFLMSLLHMIFRETDPKEIQKC